jgi:hypothetical protein
VNAHANQISVHRSGNPWVYVRHNGRKIRIKEPIGSAEFARADGNQSMG